MLILNNESKPGQPSYSREQAFVHYFNANGCKVYHIDRPNCVKDALYLVVFIFRNKIDFVFNSMPSFRTMWLSFIPRINVIYDVRDGWSIAMSQGYGIAREKKLLKAYLARFIEKQVFTKEKILITCTLGLKEYLECLTGKPFLFIQNGSQFSGRLTTRCTPKEVVTIVCLGKFSEYGKIKAKEVLERINVEYRTFEIRLIGSDKEENSWAIDYVHSISLGTSSLSIVPRLIGVELERELENADVGIALVRDPSYEYGTKIFDYIAKDIEVFNYFDEDNNFSNYFRRYMSGGFDGPVVSTQRQKILTDSRLYETMSKND